MSKGWLVNRLVICVFDNRYSRSEPVLDFQATNPTKLPSVVGDQGMAKRKSMSGN